MSNLLLSEGDTLSYQVNGVGEPLLLITATACPAALWPRDVVEQLSDTHRLITFDHRGTGASASSSRVVSTRSLAMDAAALLDHLGLTNVHVLGWSLGSAVAQELALERPDLVASLLLYATWARPDAFQRNVLAALRTPWIHGDWVNGLSAQRGLIFSPDFVNSAQFVRLFEALGTLLPHTPERVAMTANQWSAHAGHDASARLAQITAPCTVLVGEHDLVTGPRLGRAVAEHIPGARFTMATGPGTTHAMVIERPRQWLSLVRRHLHEVALDPTAAIDL